MTDHPLEREPRGTFPWHEITSEAIADAVRAGAVAGYSVSLGPLAYGKAVSVTYRRIDGHRAQWTATAVEELETLLRALATPGWEPFVERRLLAPSRGAARRR